jgi:two-component system response regulator NreC
MNTINVMVVDDHIVVRTGLKSLLGAQADIEVVAEANNGIEAIEKALLIRPDVIVMDISMPEMDGMEATRKLQKKCPECKVLALTVHEDKQYFFEMLGAGAKGYISKQAASDELVLAIRAVASGNVYLQPALARWLLDDYYRISKNGGAGAATKIKVDTAGLEVLSKRERQVLEMVAEGLTTPEIGEKLELSPKTVSRHRERIMDKLNLHSCADLVKFAVRTGLIDVH